MPVVNSAKAKRLKERLSLGPLSVGYSVEGNGKKDVKFRVENKIFTAHSEILCELSPAFYQMFRGPFAREKVIELKDISASAFDLFLKLVYNGTRSISVTLTPGDTLECMLIANRYLIEGLEAFLRTKLLRHITYMNALEVLPFCDLTLNIWSIRSKCWSVIERDTNKILKTDDFLVCSWETLCDILENSRLKVNEYDLFFATKRWAEYQRNLRQRQGVKNVPSVREIIGTAIYKIRFPVMTTGEFQLVKSSGLLLPGEIKDLEKNFRKNATFPIQPRRYLCHCRKHKPSCGLCLSDSKPSVIGDVQGAKYYPTNFWALPQGPRINNSIELARRRLTTFGFAPVSSSTLVCDVNSNNQNSRRVIPDCECYKYKSCPAFPNGTTATVLRREGYNFI